MNRLTRILVTMTFFGVGLAQDAAQPVVAPNETGIYTTVTASEHADEGRSHRFGAAVFTGELDSAENNRVSTRVAPRSYPGTFNMVTRNPDELFVYFGSYGDIVGANGPTVARLDAHSLEEIWRTPIAEITPPNWNYPGAIGLHGNGYLYVVAGNLIAMVDPDTGDILKTSPLPTADASNSSYNGFMTGPDGTIFVKPIYRTCDEPGGGALLECPDQQTPSVLSAIDPATLEVIAQVDLVEPVFGRLVVGTHDEASYVYTQGATRLFRYLWHEGELSLDRAWGFVSVLKDGQVGTASPTVGKDWLFFQTNGLPSTTPMTVWAISTGDSTQRFSTDPFADLTRDESFNIAKGSFDPENNRVYVADTAVGYAASLAFDPATGFEMLWREPQATLAFHTLVNPEQQRVIVMSNLTGLGVRINPLLARNEQVVFRNAATGEELARTDRLPRMSSGANIVPGFAGRFYYPAQNGKLYELTVRSEEPER